MMSGPHGGPEPTSILITFSDAGGGWFATAVMAMEPIAVEGPSSSFGRHPADALQALLERKFCALRDSDCPASLITIEQQDAAVQTLPVGLTIVAGEQADG